MSTPKHPKELSDHIRQVKRKTKVQMNELGLETLTFYYPKPGKVKFVTEQSFDWDLEKLLEYKNGDVDEIREELLWLIDFLGFTATKHRMLELKYQVNYDIFSNEILLNKNVVKMGIRDFSQHKWEKEMIDWYEKLGFKEEMKEIKISNIFGDTVKKEKFEELDEVVLLEENKKKRKILSWIVVRLDKIVQTTEKDWAEYCFVQNTN